MSSSWTDRGQWRLSARLDPERGALVGSAVKQVAQAENLSMADALVRLAEIGLAALADEGGPRALRGEEQAAVVVHLDASRVRAEPTEPAEPIDPADHVEDEHSDIAVDATTPHWDGSRLDRDLAIWGIAQNLSRPA